MRSSAPPSSPTTRMPGFGDTGAGQRIGKPGGKMRGEPAEIVNQFGAAGVVEPG